MSEIDPQEMAEHLDEDVVDDVEDTSGDEYGDGLPDYPPEHALGVESDERDSFKQRVAHGERPSDVDHDEWPIGQLVEPNASTLDDEEEMIGESVPGEGRGSEEAAMHLSREPSADR
jgi:hypothetical protein